MDVGVRARYRFAMTTELIVLAWGCVLALVHILAAAQVKTRQYGAKWNVGARDEELAPPNPIVGRLARAQANFFETFPLMIAAVAIVSIAALGNEKTALGAWLWLGGRLAYLPLYALGIPYLRSLAWGAATAGIVMVLWPALAASL
jgi:uncharacterized MAPEG superfamily protein